MNPQPAVLEEQLGGDLGQLAPRRDVTGRGLAGELLDQLDRLVEDVLFTPTWWATAYSTRCQKSDRMVGSPPPMLT
jgi:hypothetical protein